MQNNAEGPKFIDLEPLDEKQIHFAEVKLEEKHPLYKTPIYVTLPFLKPLKCLFQRCSKRDEKFTDVRLARVNSRNFKKQDEDSDPFLQFGFGVYGYFNFIKVQFFAYLMLSLLVLPQILIYAAEKGIDDGSYAEYSIGSLPYSQAACF